MQSFRNYCKLKILASRDGLSGGANFVRFG
nr:MAG TPA: hypothetical protein [Caudoviricetes sp.]